MVLRMLAASALLATPLLAGCGESLFDAHGPDAGARADAPTEVPAACPEPCIADAAADFDGTSTGATGRWRYLEDHRDRTWTAMMGDVSARVGADPNNRISSCTTTPDAPACAALPGALLISSSTELPATVDPALELNAPGATVIQLALRVHVPAGAAEQQVRIYRNSREDVLATLPATAGVTLDRSLTVDALAGDRFLVALAGGASDVAVQLFASPAGATFPADCQLAVSFGAALGNDVDNACGSDLTNNNETAATPPVFTAGPFAEQGQAADVIAGSYFRGTGVLERTGDSTVQLWVRHDARLDPYAGWLFSDLDLDLGGGIGIGIYDQAGQKLEVSTCSSAEPLMFTGTSIDYPADNAWRFVRVVHRADTVAVCIDGVLRASFATPAGKLASTYPPYLGRNVKWTSGAFLDGALDDVRVFRSALPCE